jgi:hypothetical protein
MTYSVDGVELPVGHEMTEPEGVDVLVDGESNLDEEVHDHETLGTNLEGQDLDSIGNEETRPCKSIGNREDPDHGNDTTTSGHAAMHLLLRRADSPNDEAHAHGCGGGDEKRSASHAVTEERARNGDDERKNGKTTVDTKLSVTVGYTDRVVDISGVVRGKTVARPLREETERREEHEPVPVALGLEEIEVGRSLLVLEFETESLLDLGVFKLDSGVVDVAVGVVLSEHLKGLLVPLLGDQPTWRLWDEPDESKLDDGRSSLGEGWDPPAPVAVNALGTESQPGADNGTDVPQAVVDGSDTSTMLRMADLGKEQRRRKLSKRITETHEETSTHEVVEILSGSLDGSTDDHDQASKDDASLAAKVVGNEGSNGKRGDRTDGVEGSQKTKSGLSGVAEVVLPVIEDTEVVQHGSD